jgi:PadR family transcriptional regulator, regulatory protein PadR
MDLNPWQSQLRKGAAELVVLAVLARGEAYGLQILDRANAQGEVVSDGALYPLLTRLEKAGKIAARWDTEQGPNPRKYYRLTPEGEAMLGEMRRLWGGFREMMDNLVQGEG